MSSVNLGSKRKQRYSSLPPSGGFGKYSGVVRAAIALPVSADWDGVCAGFYDATGLAAFEGLALCCWLFFQVNLLPDFVHLYLTLLINVVLFSLGQTPPAFVAAELAKFELLRENKRKATVSEEIIFERIRVLVANLQSHKRPARYRRLLPEFGYFLELKVWQLQVSR